MNSIRRLAHGRSVTSILIRVLLIAFFAVAVALPLASMLAYMGDVDVAKVVSSSAEFTAAGETYRIPGYETWNGVMMTAVTKVTEGIAPVLYVEKGYENEVE